MNQRSPWQGIRRLLRKPFTDTLFAEPVNLAGKRMIVTGAAPGSLGFATALALAEWGAEVVVTTRSQPERVLEALRAQLPAERRDGVTAQVLDLADPASVDAFAQWYRQGYGEQLDVLVNNAGIHLDLLSQWQEPQLTADQHEIHWRINYLGSFQLTQALLPLLLATAERSGDARVVNLVSHLHNRAENKHLFGPIEPYNSWVAYGASKLAMVHATFELQRRYADKGLRAYCLHPGGVFTGIADKGLEGSRVLSKIRKALAPVEALFLLSPEEGAQSAIYCATSAQAQGGRYYVNCQEAPPSREADDVQVAEKLWLQTQAWVDSLPAA